MEPIACVQDWLSNHRHQKPVYQVAGYAGTGKSTLAAQVVQSFNGLVYVATYTGKAAHVLRSKGISEAVTIHQLIYQPKKRSKKRLMEIETLLLKCRTEAEREKLEDEQRKEQENLKRPTFALNPMSRLYQADLLILDEYSMVDEKVGQDLLSFDVPILAFGDPGQLPPVKGRCHFNGEPDLFLTEIHRQEADNPIIQLASTVRRGKPLQPGVYGSCHVIPISETTKADRLRWAKQADQVLVGRNRTRNAANQTIRGAYGRTGDPCVGDKLVCLQNNYDVGTLNGQLFTVIEPAMLGNQLRLTVENEEGEVISTWAEMGAPNFYAGNSADTVIFDYGYALTVHKAQGSEWRNVLLIDEWHFSDRTKWLYTAITRASESITILS